MSSQIIISGNYADLKFVKTRSVAVVMIEIPIEKADAFIAAFGSPRPGTEVPVALARMNTAAPERRHGPKLSAADKQTWEDMPSAQQAGIRCGEARFWAFLNQIDHDGYGVVRNAEEAAAAVRTILGVNSRKEIAGNPEAFAKWEALDQEYQDFVFMDGRTVR